MIIRMSIFYSLQKTIFSTDPVGNDGFFKILDKLATPFRALTD